ncbi:MAG: flagellar hook-length control protein FliK [Betaproteobacteria bacterium]
MSALPPVSNANTKPAATHPQASNASPEPADEGVSFNDVLDAQLSGAPTRSSAGPVLLQDDPLAGKAASIKADGADDAAAVIDLSALIPVVATVPVAVLATVVASNAGAAAGDAIPSIAISALPIKATETQPKTASAEPLVAAIPDTANTATAAASFAADAKALPVAAEDLKRSVLTDGDTQMPPTQSDINAVATPTRETRVADLQQPQATASIPGTVGESRWSEALSQRVVWMAGQQLQSASFRVEPPQLGPIEVRLSISNDQANLLFTAAHGVARDAIQASLPRLQEMLADSGLTLGNVSVGSQTPQGQPDSGNQAQRFASDSERSFGTASVSPIGALDNSASAVRRSVGLVDLFA